MRVRPFFWFVLLGSCLGIMLFAATLHVHVPAILHARVVEQHIISHNLTTVELLLTDAEGVPIDEAQIASLAHMTNMPMASPPTNIRSLGQGAYRAQIFFSMAGPWAITIRAHAEGFDPLLQTLLVTVA